MSSGLTEFGEAGEVVVVEGERFEGEGPRVIPSRSPSEV